MKFISHVYLKIILVVIIGFTLACTKHATAEPIFPVYFIDENVNATDKLHSDSSNNKNEIVDNRDKREIDKLSIPEESNLKKNNISLLPNDGSENYPPRRGYISSDADVRVESNNTGNNFKKAVFLALKWHPIINRAKSELAQSEINVEEVEAGYYPKISAGLKSGYENNGDNSIAKPYTSALVLNASQIIYDFDKTQSKIRVAKANVVQRKNDITKTQDDISYKTATSYLQVVRFIMLKKIAEQQVDGLTSINKIAKKRVELGASAQSEYSQSRVKLASAFATLHEYESQLDKWAETLDSLTNSEISSRVVNKFPDDIVQYCIANSTKNDTSANVLVAKAKVDIAMEQVKSSSAELYPTISLNPSYRFYLDNARSDFSERRGQWGVFLNVDVPIYEGGQKMSRLHQSEQALIAAQYNLETVKEETNRNLQESQSQLSEINNVLEAKLERVGQATRTRDLFKLQYLQSGGRTLTDLLSAESEIHQTNLDIVNTEYNLASLSLDCVYYSGNLDKYFK